jgi:7-cyano-7-deazaguanine reductase
MDNLSLLGRPAAVPQSPDQATLESFDNPESSRNYLIRFEAAEFTCVCPVTGQPDFATFSIAYIPNKRCVELKSLKLYLMSFRNHPTFHEAVTNRILSELATLLEPRAMEVVGDFAIRGGIKTVVSAAHGDLDLLKRLK